MKGRCLVRNKRRPELKRIRDLDRADPLCPICKGEGWVCEDHPLEKWNDGLTGCQLPGAPCKCNPLSKAR